MKKYDGLYIFAGQAKDDVLEGRVPADTILLCSNSIDWHSGGKDASGTVYLVLLKKAS